MKEHYKNIILGATFYGCGLAAREGDSLLVEHSIHPGSDFIYSAVPGLAPLGAPLTAGGAELQNDLKNANALTENGLQMAALAPYFAKWCLARKLEILFAADPVAVEGDLLTVMTVAGKKHFTFENLIDTRPKNDGRKFLTGFTLTPEGTPEGMYGKLEFRKCEPLSRMGILLELAGKTSWSDARKEFLLAWEQRGPDLRDARLLWTASAFLYGKYGNYLAALEEGLKGE